MRLATDNDGQSANALDIMAVLDLMLTPAILASGPRAEKKWQGTRIQEFVGNSIKEVITIS